MGHISGAAAQGRHFVPGPIFLRGRTPREGMPVESFIYCFNAIIPLFLMIFLGRLLVWKGGVPRSFVDILNDLVYKWLIPASLFRRVYQADLYAAFDGKLILFTVGGTAFLFFAGWFIGAKVFGHGQGASFAQCCFRGNYTLMAIPLMEGLLGSSEIVKASVMAPIAIVLYSVLAILGFTIEGSEKGQGILRKIGNILLSLIKNPFIIAVIIALPFSIFQIQLPQVIFKPIDYLATISTPVAMIGIGGVLTTQKLRENWGPSLAAALAKTIIAPLLMLPLAIWLGFRGTELGIITVLFSTPVAVNAYSTAKAMGGNGDMTANAVLFSTVISACSLVFSMTLLMELGLI